MRDDKEWEVSEKRRSTRSSTKTGARLRTTMRKDPKEIFNPNADISKGITRRRAIKTRFGGGGGGGN